MITPSNMNKLQATLRSKVARKRKTSSHLHENVEKSGEAFMVDLFNEMVVRVPAYQSFLHSKGIRVDTIKSFSELSGIPSVDKDNYLRSYERAQVCWDGSFGKGFWVVSTTSGSTGQPFYFPRTAEQDIQYAITAERYLVSNFNIDKKSTIYIVAFPMGAWIGGLFTYEAARRVAEKGYDLSVITPGIHKQSIIDAIKQLSGSFDQVIIGAYAPFLKDILEDGERSGIDWKALDVKFIFSAEAFSENFRDYVAKKVSLRNIYKDTLNHYGTVDLGTMAHETPLSVMIRRWLVENNLLGNIFPESVKQPTLCQYDPTMFFFEEVDNTLLCSARSGIPLLRYDLKDYGGVYSYDRMKNLLLELNFDIEAEARRLGIADTLQNQPFVYVYERKDFSVSYYAANIYPEPIKKALLNDELNTNVTGKFTMSVDYDKDGQQKLRVTVECAQDGKSTDDDLRDRVAKVVHECLLHESTEYPEIFRMIGDGARPVIALKPYEDEQYFRPGTKQKWVMK